MTAKSGNRVIEQSDFCLNLVRALFLQGLRSFNDRITTSDGINAWHLSVHQAYVWLEYYFQDDPDRVAFYIGLDPMHGVSRCAADELNFLLTLRYVRTWSPGDGTVELLMDEDDEREAIASSSVPVDMLTELAERFHREYRLPYRDRSWPKGWDSTTRQWAS